MRRAIFSLILTCIVTSFCCGQKIESKKVFGGYLFEQEGQRLTMGQLVYKMQVHPESYALIKKASSGNTLASVIGFVGGGLIGWPIGAAIGGGDPNWALAGIGAGLIIVAIPISSSATQNARAAVDIYNTSIGESSSFYEIRLNGTQNGIGLMMSF